MKKLSAFSLAVLCSAWLASPAPLCADEATGAPDASGKGAYTITEGDTLWDLSGSYLRDPFLWKEIWKANPGVKDPDLIYPGDQLVIPGITGETMKAKDEAAHGATPPGAAPAATPGPYAAPGRESGREEPFVYIGKTIIKEMGEKKQPVQDIEEEKPPRLPIAQEQVILEAGFILADLDDASSVAGTPMESSPVFTQADEVYVGAREQFKEGDRLVIFRPQGEVDDPGTGKSLGTAVKVTGLLQLKQKKDRFFLAVIDTAFSEIYLDDLALPYTRPEPVYEPVPSNPSLKGIWGYVSDFQNEHSIGSLGSVVYLDMGKDYDVKPGDKFVIRRSGGTTSIPDDEHNYIVPKQYIMPDVEVGEVQVIAVQPGTSTALITRFNEPVRLGYRVYYKD